MDVAQLQKNHREKLEVQASIAKALNELQLDASETKQALESGEGLDALMSGEQLEKRAGLLILWNAAKQDAEIAADQLDAARLEQEYDAIPLSSQAQSQATILGSLEAFSEGKLDAASPFAGDSGKVLEFPQPYIRKNAAGLNEVTPFPVQFTKAGDMDYVATERFANQLLEGAVGTGTTGVANSIPLSLLGLFRQALHYNRIMARATVRPVPYMKGTYKGTVRTSPNKAVIVNEATAIPEKDPTYAPLEVAIYKYGAFVQLSFEGENTIQPWSLMGDLEDNLSEAMGTAMAEHHAVGSGANQPQGVVTGAGKTITVANGAAATTLVSGWKTISQLWSTLKPAYRASTSFTIMASDMMFGTISAMTDETTSNRPMFRWTEDPNVMPIIDGYLANRAVMQVPEMTEDTAGAFPVAAGDLSRYLILLAGGLRVESSEHVKFLNDQIVIRALQSSGAITVIPEAFNKVATTAK